MWRGCCTHTCVSVQLFSDTFARSQWKVTGRAGAACVTVSCMLTLRSHLGCFVLDVVCVIKKAKQNKQLFPHGLDSPIYSVHSTALYYEGRG